jgi:hypothetical protein
MTKMHQVAFYDFTVAGPDVASIAGSNAANTVCDGLDPSDGGFSGEVSEPVFSYETEQYKFISTVRKQNRTLTQKFGWPKFRFGIIITVSIF